MKKVLTHGTFDVPHLGHAIFLQRAASLGDYLMVGLSSDEYAKSQNKNLVYSYEERFNLLSLLPYIKLIYKNEFATMRVAIVKYRPDIIVIGSDWGDRYFEQIGCSPQWLASQGVTLVYLPYTKEISTTDIKRRCK